MEKIWEFFENMNELVYVVDVDTYEFICMNKRALSICGLASLEETKGKKCYEVLQNTSVPCVICNNKELVQGEFKEWRYYNPVCNRHSLVKDTLIEMDGRKLRMEIAVDISTDTKQNELIRDYQNREALINEALRTAMQASDPDVSLQIAIEYLGKALGGERVFIFEKNADGNGDNTEDGIRQIWHDARFRGRKRLRYWLFQAAKPAVAHAEEFKELHAYYTTRADNPLKKMQPLIVIACKLLRIIYAILKNGTVYGPKKMLMDIRRPEKKEAAAA